MAITTVKVPTKDGQIPLDKVLDQSRRHFEPELKRLELGVDDIEKQGPPQLQKSLEKVNNLLEHPEQFGSLLVSIGPSRTEIVSTEKGAEVGITPVLLERKGLIIDRMHRLNVEQPLETLADQASQIPINAVEQPLETVTAKVDEISNLARIVADSTAESKADATRDLDATVQELKNATEQAKRGVEQTKTQAQYVKSTAEAVQREARTSRLLQEDQSKAVDQKVGAITLTDFQTKAGIVRSFLEKDSLAAIIGAILLVFFSAAVIAAMFIPNVQASDIVKDAFFVVLGYFFGQAIGKVTGSGGSQEGTQK